MSARSILVIVLLLAAGGVTFSRGRAASQAGHHAEAIALQLARLQADVPEVLNVRRELASLPQGEPEQTGLVGDVNGALMESGISVSVLTSLIPNAGVAASVSDGFAGGLRINRTSARLTLDQIALPQLGRFLDTWRRRQPRWTVSSIQLQPQQGPSGPQSTKSPAVRVTGGRTQQPLRVHLVLESVCIIQKRKANKP